jgi:Apea-like HEPN
VLTDAARSTMLGLVQGACHVVTPSRYSVSGSRCGIAYYDTSRDEPITEVTEFAGAVAALQADPVIAAIYGSENVQRLAIQFVYNTCGLLDDGIDILAAFEATWNALVTESSQPHWRFAAVANLSNFSFAGDIADLGHGVSIQGRSFDRLRQTLGFNQVDLDVLAEDWSAGGATSSYVLVVETSQPKTPANFILASDGVAYPRAARALLAMRLTGAGAPHIGRMFLKWPAAFNTGIGGRSYAGFTIWWPGAQYNLTETMIPEIRQQVDTLIAVDKDLETSARHIGLALRSFSSIYDRLMHQGEDCVIDSIAALEALWRLDSELSFRLAFRTSSLLGTSDDLREQVFETLRTYYGIRSKIVHGTTLRASELALVQNDEPLREIVRKTLRAFIHLLANPGEWTIGRLARDPDTVLLHSEKRSALQRAMAVLPLGAP